MKITIMRLSLGAIIGIVSESAAAAPVLGAVISVVFALFFAEHQPYAERSDNRLSIVLAFSLVLFFLAALMIKVDATSDDGHDQEVFEMLLVAFLCAGPVMSVVEVFWDWLMSPGRLHSSPPFGHSNLRWRRNDVRSGRRELFGHWLWLIAWRVVSKAGG